MPKIKSVHWFPGHMKKALNEIIEKVKIVDAIVEVLDARIPLSSLNNDLEEIIKNKPVVYVLNKSDLSDPLENEKSKKYFLDKNRKVIVGSLTDKKTISKILDSIKETSKFKKEKDIKKGLKPQPIKLMILGIPNAGKSTLINKLANRKAAGVQNRPGYTRSEQWIRNDDFYLLDTPGVLQSKYESEEKATKLALIGSIRDDILPFYDLANSLLDILFSLYGENVLYSRFDIKKENFSNEEIFLLIAKKRGLLKGNEFDIEKAQRLLLKEYKDGLLGKLNLEKF